MISISEMKKILEVVAKQILGILHRLHCILRRAWRYQKAGNQNPYIEEEQTTQWSKEKGQKDKQRSTKHTYTTKDRVTRTPLKTEGELRKGKQFLLH
jgi:uncharacterized protein YxeA